MAMLWIQSVVKVKSNEVNALKIVIVPADPSQLELIPEKGKVILTGQSIGTRKTVRFSLKNSRSKTLYVKNLQADIYDAALSFIGDNPGDAGEISKAYSASGSDIVIYVGQKKGGGGVK